MDTIFKLGQAVKCCPVVIELQHFDPSASKNTRVPVAMKLNTPKDGCLQTTPKTTNNNNNNINNRTLHLTRCQRHVVVVGVLFSFWLQMQYHG
jgi:hypothetical protein